MTERSISALPLTAGGDRPSKAFKKDRVCQEEGCSTRLSIYNSGKFCAQHAPMIVPRTRGRKIA